MGCPITRGAPRRHVRNQRPSAHLNSAARGAPESWVNIPSKRQDARRPQPHPALLGLFSLTEGDLIRGKGASAIATLVERTSRLVLLAKLDAVDAETVAAALRTHIQALPTQLRRSLTWDQGKEMARHAQFTIDTGVQVYFCDPESPWQRGSNENTNGLLRQYLPKRTDLKAHSQDDLDAIAAELNDRPRQTLEFMTPSVHRGCCVDPLSPHG